MFRQVALIFLFVCIASAIPSPKKKGKGHDPHHKGKGHDPHHKGKGGHGHDHGHPHHKGKGGHHHHHQGNALNYKVSSLLVNARLYIFRIN